MTPKSGRVTKEKPEPFFSLLERSRFCSMPRYMIYALQLLCEIESEIDSLGWSLTPGFQEADEIDRLKNSPLEIFAAVGLLPQPLTEKLRDTSASVL